jgi:hypothetical protein
MLSWMQITYLRYIWIRVEIVTSWKSGILWSWFSWNHCSCVDWRLGGGYFFEWGSLSSVTFESGSRLSRIEMEAFKRTDLVEITLPASVEVLGEKSFSDCGLLSSIRFESQSGSREVGRNAFSGVPIRTKFRTKKCCLSWINSATASFPLSLSLSQFEKWDLRCEGLCLRWFSGGISRGS